MYDMSGEKMELDDAFSWFFLWDDLLSFYHGKSHRWTEKNSLYFNQTVEEAILHSRKLTIRPGKIGGWEILGDYSIFLLGKGQFSGPIWFLWRVLQCCINKSFFPGYVRFREGRSHKSFFHDVKLKCLFFWCKTPKPLLPFKNLSTFTLTFKTRLAYHPLWLTLLENDHISLLQFGMFESMIFRTSRERWDITTFPSPKIAPL